MLIDAAPARADHRQHQRLRHVVEPADRHVDHASPLVRRSCRETPHHRACRRCSPGSVSARSPASPSIAACVASASVTSKAIDSRAGRPQQRSRAPSVGRGRSSAMGVHVDEVSRGGQAPADRGADAAAAARHQCSDAPACSSVRPVAASRTTVVRPLINGDRRRTQFEFIQRGSRHRRQCARHCR